jgi:peptidoglycan L-alanyl-D-glutamate endopeptidase CwlK
MSFTSERVNQLNDERLKQINPVVAAKVRKIIALAAAQGFTLLVVQGLRTIAEQNALFAQGRTKKGKIVTKARGGQSWHNYGLAVDFAFITNGEVDWTDALYRKIGGWAKLAGLEWGGAWRTITDLPHVQQINGMKTADALAVYNKSGLHGVWENIS